MASFLSLGAPTPNVAARAGYRLPARTRPSPHSPSRPVVSGEQTIADEGVIIIPC